MRLFFMGSRFPGIPAIVISGEVETYRARFVDNRQVVGYLNKFFCFFKLSVAVGAVHGYY